MTIFFDSIIFLRYEWIIFLIILIYLFNWFFSLLLIFFHDFEYLFDKFWEIIFIKVAFVVFVQLFHKLLYFLFGGFLYVHKLCCWYHNLLKFRLLYFMIAVDINCLERCVCEFVKFLLVLQYLIPHFILFVFL